MTESPPKNYPNCFGCGESNPIGLRLQYRKEDDELVTEFVPSEVHEGWPDIVHGGIIASLLYEVMENYPFYQGIIAMMRSMETRFRRPAKIERRILAKARLVEQSGREISVQATLTGEEGELIAEGKAEMVALDHERARLLGIT